MEKIYQYCGICRKCNNKINLHILIILLLKQKKLKQANCLFARLLAISSETNIKKYVKYIKILINNIYEEDCKNPRNRAYNTDSIAAMQAITKIKDENNNTGYLIELITNAASYAIARCEYATCTDYHDKTENYYSPNLIKFISYGLELLNEN